MDINSNLVLAKQYASLTDLSAWIEAIVERHGLPARAAFGLDLVLTEAVTNIIDYAGPIDQPGSISLACAVRADRIELELCDDGPAFDPTARPPMVLPTNLAEAKPGGLGIHLIKQYTTRMEYHRVGGRNILSMIVPVETGTASI